MGPLAELEVVALDCQAGGATPQHGDLIELGWAVCQAGQVGPVQSNWIVPRTGRPIRRAIRELTGWSEQCVACAIDEAAAWAMLREELGAVAHRQAREAAPAVIHFARFELGFLRDLHERLEPGRPFPIDAVCLHAVARRLFPDLPRRNIRALAGFLGHSPELMRRSAGHVQATAFIWQALIPLLEQAGVHTWPELAAWLEEPAPSIRRSRRVFPLPVERRRALPDAPGVYRFVRKNGDVLYVGKAVSLKKRVASHFTSGNRANERALELLTQVHDIQPTRTESLLEAALLETDEIKRIDPPYNVQLRVGDRRAWFASRDFSEAVPEPDDAHPVGPLPSRRALFPLWALGELVRGATPSARLCANALAVPAAFLPPNELFEQGLAELLRDRLLPLAPAPVPRLASVSRELYLERGRSEPESEGEELAPGEWDLARVRRRLERSLVQCGLLARRTRVLCLLCDASVAFREPDQPRVRALVIERAEIVERFDLGDLTALGEVAARRPAGLRERQRSFDAATYDRMRVLLTELHRIRDDGGDVAIRIGAHVAGADRLARILRAV